MNRKIANTHLAKSHPVFKSYFSKPRNTLGNDNHVTLMLDGIPWRIPPPTPRKLQQL